MKLTTLLKTATIFYLVFGFILTLSYINGNENGLVLSIGHYTIAIMFNMALYYELLKERIEKIK